MARFIAALRASGVRVSVAESQDAWRAIAAAGITDRDTFRLSLRSTLVKDFQSLDKFEDLFPQYFGTGAPPLIDPQAELSQEQQEMLQQAMQQMAMDLQQLLEWLLSGRGPSQEELDQLAEQAGMDDMNPARSSYQARRQAQFYARRMQQLLNWEQLRELLEQLWEALAEAGMDPGTIQQLQERVAENMDALQDQLGEYAGRRVLDNVAEDAQQRRPLNDLMERPFQSLNNHEMDQLREQVRRLAARLRSRAALRQKRGKQGKLDAKSTIRANLRYGSVPFEIRLKQRRLKPKLVVILDISTSMRPVAEFFLRLLYELQDQVQKTRSFAFIDHLEDVTGDLSALGIDEAVQVILGKLPPGYYSTDLGYSLRQFEEHHLDAVDGRTTVIVVGDGRNNYNDPNLETLTTLSRRARKLIWMTPEFSAQWGTGDSDMLLYEPLCHEIFMVRNLAQLAEAIDHMLAA
ncbi:MAG: VWA domain-containing protein [Anaerolineae bacterium]|nr:VWA domain-containing protein [Anaerolineae bacterium]